MTTDEKAAPAGQPGAAQYSDFSASQSSTPARVSASPSDVGNVGRAPKRIKPGSKTAAVLKMFLERGDRGANCFEAVRWARDYVLRSSVSNLTRQHGLAFDRRFERVVGHGGAMVDCVRYQIAPGSRQRARELLGLAEPCTLATGDAPARA